MEDLKNDKIEMKTLVSCCNMLEKQGYSTQFKASPSGLKSLTTKKMFSPQDVKIVNFYRFEGDSSPEDNSILYAIETNDGEKGTLTDAFGPYSDTNVTNFVKQVEDIEKKVDKEKSL